MLHLYIKDSRFFLKLDRENPYYARTESVIRTMLTSFEVGNGIWTIGFDDLMFLKNRLDMLGLTEGRSMSAEAHLLIKQKKQAEAFNENVKKGWYDDHIKSLLEGKVKSTPYPDQLKAIAYAVYNWRCGIFDAMGSGKTLASLYASILANENPKILVICPLSVMYGFERGIVDHTFLRPLPVPSGRKKALTFLENLDKQQDWDVLLVHPENLIASNRKGVKKRRGLVYGETMEHLRKLKIDTIIIDEFHMYKNLDTKRAKCVIDLANKLKNSKGDASRVILLTGSPVSETPKNAYTALKILGKEVLPHIDRFEHQYCIKNMEEMTVWVKRGNKKYRETRRVPKITGYKNLGELKQRISKVSIRRTKAEMTGFPDKLVASRQVYLSGKQLKLYKTLLGEAVKDLPKTSQINIQQFLTGNKILRLRQLLNHPQILGEDANSAKYDELEALFDELFVDPHQKVVVWTEYRAGVDLIYDRFNQQHGVIKLYGGVSIDDNLARSFEAVDGPRVVAAIPAKAGTGVDFLARARTAVYVDRPSSYVNFKQSLDRIHRRVKTNGDLSWLDTIRAQPATLLFLDVPDSVDWLVRDALNQKDNVAEAIMTSDEVLIQMGRGDLLRYLR